LTENYANLSVIVLAAGKGKRMKSDIPKVLHQVCFKSLIYYILKAIQPLNPANVFVVVGHKGEMVSQYIQDNFPQTIAVTQESQLGTAHAVKTAGKYINNMGSQCLILPGDVPLITTGSLQEVIKNMHSTKSACTILSFIASEPAGYGRIIKDKKGDVRAIVEETDASPEQKQIKEVNSSIYCFDTRLLFEQLKTVSSENSQKEFYLTDVIESLVKSGNKVSALTIDDPQQVEGINDRLQLACLEKMMQKRINDALMLEGVTIRFPESTFIGPEVSIGKDTIIEPGCLIRGKTEIGQGCTIGPDTQIEDCTIGPGTKINRSVLQGAVIGPSNNIGPTSYIRPGTVTAGNVKIGACCEIKKSYIAAGSKVPHLSYIGDAEVGENVNIGAGTITCNYDGFLKNKTVIEDGVFIGSDTMLVAPVRIGKGAITAAGSAIGTDVPPDSLAIERTPQANIEDGAVRFREKKLKQKKELETKDK